MVNENNAYSAIEKGAFPGRWKRLHGLRGMPDYLVWVPGVNQGRITVSLQDRQFLVEVKEIESYPTGSKAMFKLELRPAQIPFFSARGGWPGEKYVLVRWQDTKGWTWFSGAERYVSLRDQIKGPFKR